MVRFTRGPGGLIVSTSENASGPRQADSKRIVARSYTVDDKKGGIVPAFKYKLSSKSGPISVEDYRRLARRAVPDMVWAYIDYGSDDLTTLQANRRAFGRYSLRARVLTGNVASDLSVTVGRQELSLPVLLAPTGLVGLSHWKGELGAAQAA